MRTVIADYQRSARITAVRPPHVGVKQHQFVLQVRIITSFYSDNDRSQFGTSQDIFKFVYPKGKSRAA